MSDTRPGPPPSSRRDRLPAGAAALGMHLALGYALLTGLGIDLPRRPERTLSLFEVAPPPPTPPKEEPAPRPARAPEPEGRAAPPNLRATPSPVVAPPPVLQLPPPMLAAPVAATGTAPTAGAALTPGPGTGAGGLGDGLGAGGRGTGPGGGGAATPSRQIAGAIHHRDYPAAARRTGAQGSVIVNLHINARGRVARCDVARSSGHPELDDGTCRLISKRFRYEPARDASGRPVTDLRAWKQDWWIEPRSLSYTPVPR